MNDWLKTASATFAGGAVAIGLVAIPTFIWLPREFDGIRADISESRTALDALAPELQAIRADVRSLVASDQLNQRDSDAKFEMIEYLAAILDNDGAVRDQILGAHMPMGMLTEWESAGKLGLYKGSVVNGTEYIFIDNFNVTRVPAQDIEALERASEADGFEFKIWDVSIFPGTGLTLTLGDR